ncbi:MAG: hypothetical protein ACOXZS_01665 [Bacilli bacterium]|jgi:surface polysaccharide O-acyltransferase-like enzyme
MYFLETIPDECRKLRQLILFVNGLLNLIRIAVPILLVIIGSFDLGKAVVAGDEKEIKTTQGLLVKRLISAAAVFFVVTLVRVIMGIVDPNWVDCLNYYQK